jgi:hypothetical protein
MNPTIPMTHRKTFLSGEKININNFCIITPPEKINMLRKLKLC